MRINRNWTLALAVMAAMVLAGCNSTQNPDNNHAQQVKNAQAANQNPGDRTFEQTAKDPPLTANTHFAAGQVAEAQGKINNAIEHYWAAVKLNPKHKEALYHLGVIYTQLKRFPDAIAAWKLYVEAAGHSADAYSNLACCYELSGDSTQAEDAYRQGIAVDPKSNPCRVNYGLLLARNGRTGDAIIQFQAVLPPAQVHYNLAAVYERQGKIEQAKEEYHRALALDPKCLDAAARLQSLH